MHSSGLKMQCHFVALAACALLALAPHAHAQDNFDAIIRPLLSTLSLPSMIPLSSSMPDFSSSRGSVSPLPSRIMMRFVPMSSAQDSNEDDDSSDFGSFLKQMQGQSSNARSFSSHPIIRFSSAPSSDNDSQGDDLLSMLMGQQAGTHCGQCTVFRSGSAPQASFPFSLMPLNMLRSPASSSTSSSALSSSSSPFASRMTTVTDNGKVRRTTTVTTDDKGQETHTTETKDSESSNDQVRHLNFCSLRTSMNARSLFACRKRAPSTDSAGKTSVAISRLFVCFWTACYFLRSPPPDSRLVVSYTLQLAQRCVARRSPWHAGSVSPAFVKRTISRPGNRNDVDFFALCRQTQMTSAASCIRSSTASSRRLAGPQMRR